MPDAPLPLSWHQVVREHHRSTEGYIVAEHGLCLKIRDDERRHVRGRSFQPLTADALPASPPRSWFVGVILCPGDDTEALTPWASKISALDLDRIHFYFTPSTDLGLALAAWRAAGLREPKTYEVRDFRTFHKLFGRHNASRVYIDHIE